MNQRILEYTLSQNLKLTKKLTLTLTLNLVVFVGLDSGLGLELVVCFVLGQCLSGVLRWA